MTRPKSSTTTCSPTRITRSMWCPTSTTAHPPSGRSRTAPRHAARPAHAAPLGADEAADDVEESGLARAVGSDDADDPAGLDHERQVVERHQATEAHPDAVQRQAVHGHHARSRRRCTAVLRWAQTYSGS